MQSMTLCCTNSRSSVYLRRVLVTIAEVTQLAHLADTLIRLLQSSQRTVAVESRIIDCGLVDRNYVVVRHGPTFIPADSAMVAL